MADGVRTPTHGKRNCGCDDCPPGGDCADGEECLPSDYIDPADCPPGDTLTPRAACINLLGFGKSDGDVASGETYDVSCLAPPDNAVLVVLVAYETCDDSSQPDVVVTDDVAYTWTDLEQAHGPGGCTLGGAIVTTDAGVGDPPFVLHFAPDTDRAMNWTVSVYAVTCSDGVGTHDSLITDKTTSSNAPSLALTLADAQSRVIGFLVADQDGEPWPQVATTGTELTNAGPSPAVVFSITDAGNDTLAYDVTGQEWDNDLVFAVELLGAADGGACTCSPDCPTCADCTCSADAYQPYCIGPENADDPATVIVGLGPWSYYPMDDASGLLVDASGNGRDATSTGGGSITYAAAPITAKRSASIEFEGGHFVLPKPFNLDSGNTWTAIWLEHVLVFRGAGSPAQGAVMLGQETGGVQAAMTLINGASGDLYELWGVQSGIGCASYVPNADLIGRSAVICLQNAPASQPRLYIDGVLWGAAQNGGTVGASNLCLGASDSGFWGYPQHRMSDFALFDRALTFAEIQEITAALADSALFATAIVTP